MFFFIGGLKRRNRSRIRLHWRGRDSDFSRRNFLRPFSVLRLVCFTFENTFLLHVKRSFLLVTWQTCGNGPEMPILSLFIVVFSSSKLFETRYCDQLWWKFIWFFCQKELLLINIFFVQNTYVFYSLFKRNCSWIIHRPFFIPISVLKLPTWHDSIENATHYFKPSISDHQSSKPYIKHLKTLVDIGNYPFSQLSTFICFKKWSFTINIIESVKS